jgi:hypothetical protein
LRGLAVGLLDATDLPQVLHRGFTVLDHAGLVSLHVGSLKTAGEGLIMSSGQVLVLGYFFAGESRVREGSSAEERNGSNLKELHRGSHDGGKKKEEKVMEEVGTKEVDGERSWWLLLGCGESIKGRVFGQ